MHKVVLFSALVLGLTVAVGAEPARPKAKPKVVSQIRHIDSTHTEITIRDSRPHIQKAARPAAPITVTPAAQAPAPALQAAAPFQELNVQAPRLQAAPSGQAPMTTYSQTYAPGPSEGAAANGYSLGTPMLMNSNVGYYDYYNGGYYNGGFYNGGYFNGGYSNGACGYPVPAAYPSSPYANQSYYPSYSSLGPGVHPNSYYNQPVLPYGPGPGAAGGHHGGHGHRHR